MPYAMKIQEERLTKIRALELYDQKILDSFEVGTFAGLKDMMHSRQATYEFWIQSKL